MARGRQWILLKEFDGGPKESDLELREFEIPDVKHGEVLLEAVFLSVDPYMASRGGSVHPVNVGDVMIGEQVARVIKSKNPKFAVGTHVVADVGWTTHAVSDGSKLTKVDIPEGLPLSLALGILGMTGRSAYIGLVDVTNPKAGETVLVNGASGAVGAAVGQIAKILGCRAVGCAGSEDKVAYLKEIGFDEAFNYKTTKDLAATITSAAPNGVDVFFDNVGGHFLSTVVNKNMNPFGRIIVCGSISTYNAVEDVKVSSFSAALIGKRLKIQGFVNYDHEDRFQVAVNQLADWIKQGKMKYKEDVTNGIENMPKAFIGLFSGVNRGKAIIKI